LTPSKGWDRFEKRQTIFGLDEAGIEKRAREDRLVSRGEKLDENCQGKS
jgi:hypothetical protein